MGLFGVVDLLVILGTLRVGLVRFLTCRAHLIPELSDEVAAAAISSEQSVVGTLSNVGISGVC